MSEDIISSQCIPAVDKLPIFPEVGGDVGVEVGVAVVQGEGEGEEEAAQSAEDARSVLRKKFQGDVHDPPSKQLYIPGDLIPC